VLSTTGPYYGTGGFGGVGARTSLELDTRDLGDAAAGGTHVTLGAQWYPALWDMAHPFGSVSAEAATYLSLGDPATAILALRAGGAHVGGIVPFHSMVFIGGEATVRGYAEQRFAGRAGAYANAELRLFVGRLSGGDIGVFGLADAGRVWMPGESSDRWHGATGGGLWFAWQHRRANTVTIAAARSPEGTAMYLRAGFLF
jgi:hemolysin activation/secretion protein